MDRTENERFRDLIGARLAELAALSEVSEDSRGTVTLDQQSVGRLSRMDALQQQAMASATEARRERERQSLRAALQRLDAGEFGYCETCGEDIARKRLQLNPAATRCIDCVSG
ncbi:MAG: TraR/DksA family transcriptional regulator [Paracoccaceae bacterium]